MAEGPAYVTTGTNATGGGRVSAVLVDATLRRIDQILSSVTDSVMAIAERFQPDDWTRLGSGLPRMEGSVVDECADFAGRLPLLE